MFRSKAQSHNVALTVSPGRRVRQCSTAKGETSPLRCHDRTLDRRSTAANASDVCSAACCPPGHNGKMNLVATVQRVCRNNGPCQVYDVRVGEEPFPPLRHELEACQRRAHRQEKTISLTSVRILPMTLNSWQDPKSRIKSLRMEPSLPETAHDGEFGRRGCRLQGGRRRSARRGRLGAPGTLSVGSTPFRRLSWAILGEIF